MWYFKYLFNFVKGFPGNNADKVPIEKYYMNPDYNLYDHDIMTM